MKSIKFVSIDPSLRNTAMVYGNIDIENDIIEPVGYKLVKTNKGMGKSVRQSSDTIRRCRIVIKEISDFLDSYKPTICFAETPSGSQSSSAMKSYGVSCCFIALLRPDAIEVTPIELKKHVGSGKVSKLDVIRWVESKFPSFELDRKSDGSVKVGDMEHVADAIATACAGMKTSQYNRLKEVVTLFS